MLLDQQPITSVFTDNRDVAGGDSFEGDGFYVNWKLDRTFVANLHINSREVLAVFNAVSR